MESTFLTDIFKLVLVALLVFANGFFVMAEFALVSVRRTRIDELVAQGNTAARVVSKAIHDPDRFIAATQLGITLASLGLGWLGEPAIAHLLEPVINWIPGPWQHTASHSMAAGISFAIITFLHVVIGELAPKSIALQSPEKSSLIVARPIIWSERLFAPFIWALNGTGNALLRMLGFEAAAGHEMVHSAKEIRMLVAASAQVGAIETDEHEMVEAIFDLGETIARQVMIPRTEMVCVQADTSLEDAFTLTAKTLLTKFPVYEENLDHILGILHAKDMVRAMHNDQDNIPVRDLTREAIFMPESVPVNALLAQFRQRRQHIAILLDEFGGTAGLVTLEDLMEELVGDVQDAFDQPATRIQRLPDGGILLDGLTPIEEVNDKLNLSLFDHNYDTIAGYIMGRLGRIGQEGDVVEAISNKKRVRFQVTEMDDLRIARLKLEISDKAPQPVPEVAD